MSLILCILFKFFSYLLLFSDYLMAFLQLTIDLQVGYFFSTFDSFLDLVYCNSYYLTNYISIFLFFLNLQKMKLYNFSFKM